MNTPEIATESWQLVWRDGVAGLLPTAGLEALAEALRTDDETVSQGSTMTPPPLMCCQTWPVEAACPLCYCGWKGLNLTTVAECEEFFARVVFEADQKLGEPAASRWLLNWIDDTPRDLMRRELLAEVERELARRAAADAPALLDGVPLP